MGGHTQQETLSLAWSPPALGGFLPEVLRSPLGQTQAVPKKPCWPPPGPAPKAGAREGRLACPETPAPRAPVCILQVFHFSELMLLFQRQTCVFSVCFQ